MTAPATGNVGPPSYNNGLHLVYLHLWVVFLLLLCLGLVTIYSASAAYAIKKSGSGFYYLIRQAFYVLGCIMTALVVERIPTDSILNKARLLMVIQIVLLAGLLIPGLGVSYNQACRWYQLPGNIHIQPAEYAKVVWIIYLSDALSRRQDKLKNYREGVLFYSVIMALVAGLILKEPDFGNAFLIAVIMVFLVVAAGAPLRHFLIYLPFALLVFYFFVYKVDYRWTRVRATYDPWTSPLKEGYHLLQAWTGLGSGGLLGEGLGMGIQKLYYIPEPFTDFILAVIGHELGFLGILLTVTSYGWLFITMRRIVLVIKDFRKRLLALGITTLLMAQSLGNMAVVLGLFPTKGLPLPLISYGGSNLIATAIGLGIMMRLIKEAQH